MTAVRRRTSDIRKLHIPHSRSYIPKYPVKHLQAGGRISENKRSQIDAHSFH